MTTYHVLSKLASGGHATVYVARSEGALGVARTVALKKPHPHLLDDPEFEAAFRREATIAARLRHPNVTAVHDVVVHEGVPSLVMELVDGVTFADLIRTWTKEGGASMLGAALSVVVDAARGLHAVHELKGEDESPMGLVHRDVSPQNVLVDRAGVAKLADFGLAKALLHGGESSTTEGILKGKIGYLAPEYIRGEPMDRRADIFALGIMLWEAVTRRRLFRSEREPDVLAKILSMPIPKVSSKAASVALDGLDAILEKCLARKPSDRFTTADAVADALLAFADGHGIEVGAAIIARSFPESLRETLDARSKSLRAAPPEASAGDVEPARLSARTAAHAPVRAPASDQTQKLAAPFPDDSPTRRDVQAPASTQASTVRPLWTGMATLLLLSVLGAGGWILSARLRGVESATIAPERLAPPTRSALSLASARELLPAATSPEATGTLAPQATLHAAGHPVGGAAKPAATPKGAISGPMTGAAHSTGPRPNPYPSASR